MSYTNNQKDPFRRSKILARRTKTTFTDAHGVEVKYGRLDPLKKTGRSTFRNQATPMKISNRFALMRRLAFFKELYTPEAFEQCKRIIMSGQATRYLMLNYHPTKRRDNHA